MRIISDGRLYEVSCGAICACRSCRCRRALDQLHEGDDLLIALDRPSDHGALHHGIVRASTASISAG